MDHSDQLTSCPAKEYRYLHALKYQGHFMQRKCLFDFETVSVTSSQHNLDTNNFHLIPGVWSMARQLQRLFAWTLS